MAEPHDPELAAERTPDAVAERLNSAGQESPLRHWVYGAMDGTVTTFAVVAGASGLAYAVGALAKGLVGGRGSAPPEAADLTQCLKCTTI